MKLSLLEASFDSVAVQMQPWIDVSWVPLCGFTLRSVLVIVMSVCFFAENANWPGRILPDVSGLPKNG